MTELITTEWFNFGKESIGIGIVERGGQRWIPVSSIATAIDYDRGTLSRTIKNNRALFDGLKGVVTVQTLGGDQDSVCLNHDGFVGLLMRLDIHRIKSADKKAKIVAFQKWGIETLSKVIKGESLKDRPYPSQQVKPLPDKSPSQCVYEASKICNLVPEMDRRKVTVAVLTRHGHGYLAEFLPEELPRLPAPSPKPTGWLNATDIGRIVGISPPHVNHILYYVLKFINRDHQRPGEYRITPAGEAYGREEMYSPVPGRDSVYRVFWDPLIVERIREALP